MSCAICGQAQCECGRWDRHRGLWVPSELPRPEDPGDPPYPVSARFMVIAGISAPVLGILGAIIIRALR
jgi:hypothetical protein